MALEVEDGSAKEGADSYVSLEEANNYHAARGNTAWTGDNTMKEAALRRATAYIDAEYGARFSGTRREGRGQALAWPRSEAKDSAGEAIGDDGLPNELKVAVMEAALREIGDGAGSLMPDMERGGAIERIKAGSVEVEYADGAQAETKFTAIQKFIAPLLAQGWNGINAKAERI